MMRVLRYMVSLCTLLVPLRERTPFVLVVSKYLNGLIHLP